MSSLRQLVVTLARKASFRRRRRTDPPTFLPENEIDLVLGGANPNHERVGCPPQFVLSELARRERSMSDPWYEHIFECSPCFREVRALQQAAGEWRGTVH
jgi:hypothetical protein